MHVTVNCEIELNYSSVEEANVVLNAISPDNFQFVTARSEGSKLLITSSSETSMQMLHTMEDLLACIKIAEETFNLTH